MTSLSVLIEKQVPKERLDTIRDVALLATRQGLRLYLVGGVVRDILLGRDTLDTDLVVEGDAPALARSLAESGGWRITKHLRFGTAKLQRDSVTLDLATARRETYSRPGALPDVSPGTIEDDLQRRDFTINAMAVEVTPDRFGEVFDPHGGQADLRNKLIRVLHAESFVDDPTRIFRAIRYEKRLDFSLEAETGRLLRRDVIWLNEVSGDRLRHELELILKEDKPEKALRRAGELGALAMFHPSLQGNGWLAERVTQARERGWASSNLYLALLAFRLDDVEPLISKLKFSREASRVLRDAAALKHELPGLAAAELPPSAICEKLEGRSAIAVRACILASDNEATRARMSLYLGKWCYVKSLLTGDDLAGLGVPKGERMGEVLQALKRARLDGEIETREQEEAMVRRWLQGRGPG